MDVVVSVGPAAGPESTRGAGALPGRELAWRARFSLRAVRPFDGRAAPQGVALVLDRSHFVAPPLLQALLQGVGHGVAALAPHDYLALVLVDRQHQLLRSPAQVGEQTDWVAAQLRGVAPGDGANLCGGWLRARQQLEEAPWVTGGHAASTRHILLCSAGHVDTGISDAATLAELARSARHRGIGTSTVALGEGANRPLLEAMATAGGGRCHAAAGAAEVAHAIAEERRLLGSRSLRNLTVRLTPSDGVQVDGLTGGGEVHRPEGSSRAELALGEMRADEVVEWEVLLRCAAAQWERLRAAQAPLLVAQVDGERFTARGGTEFRTVVLPVRPTP